jgi:hypothetical protein
MSSFEIKQQDILITNTNSTRVRVSIQHGVKGAISSKQIACLC